MSIMYLMSIAANDCIELRDHFISVKNKIFNF